MAKQTEIRYIPTPEEYQTPAKHAGVIRRVDYTTGGKPKHAYVYVPYGYDSAKQYEIVYLMHGGGDRADKFIGTDDTPNQFKHALDHMMENGEVRPLLVVSPSFYPMDVELGGPGTAGEYVAAFHEELVNDLMPAVESVFSTYAQTVDKAGLKASRDHRAFGGFSMGSCTTWWQLIHSLDYISTFLPLSGDCWILGERAGATLPDETARATADCVKKTGWGKDDFEIFAATGTKDIAYDALGRQVESMKQLPDIFQFGETVDSGNFHFILAEGKEHRWEPIWDYCYDILCLLYPQN